MNEPPFQAEGNIAFHDNLLVNHHGDGIWIQPHNDRPRRVAIFHNTVVAKGTGIAVSGGLPGFRQTVARNAVFARRPIEGGEQEDNLTAGYAVAGEHLRTPFGGWRTPDLRPRPGRLQSSVAEAAGDTLTDAADRDFAGTPRQGGYLGAYAGPDAPREGPLHFPPTL